MTDEPVTTRNGGRRTRTSAAMGRGAEFLSRLILFTEGAINHWAAKRLLLDVLEEGEVLASGVSDAPHEIHGWSHTQIETFRQELLDFLRRLVASDDVTDNKGTLVHPITVGSVDLYPVAAAARVVLAIDGPARDVLWFQIVDVLRNVGVGRIKQCPACPHLFVRTGRQDHCSPACGQRLRSRRFYREHRDALLESRHATYVQRRRRSHPKAKVSRRRRRP